MGVFNFGDPANRRPGWIDAPGPWRSVAGDVARREYSPAAAAVEPTPTGGGPRVLIVDDDPVHRKLTSEMLAMWGIKPVLAADGSVAVALACELPLALILMDLQMPVLDGLGATRRIRRFERERACRRVPIVAYSSAVFDTDRLRLQQLGLDDVLTKPCKAHELHECLMRWCPATTAAAAFGDLADVDRDRPQSARWG